MSNNELCERGYISLLYSIADKPLELWSKYISLGGKIRRVKDNTLHGDKIIEITGPDNSTIPTNITIPAKAVDILNIKLMLHVIYDFNKLQNIFSPPLPLYFSLYRLKYRAKKTFYSRMYACRSNTHTGI